jgi:hypothetical protein
VVNNVDGKINSNEYRCKLAEHLSLLLNKTKSAENEAQVSQHFQSEIYFFVRTFFGIDLNFHPEENQSTLRHTFKGRMDAVCNNLVIEYKQSSKLSGEKDKEKATTQISNYLMQLFEEDGSKYYGILTDGVIVRYVYFQEEELHQTPFKNIDVDDLDKIIKSMINVNNKKFVPKNIVEDFKMESVNGATKDLFKYLYKKLIKTDHGKSFMLFEEWKVLFHLSENDKGQNEDIAKRRKALSKIIELDIDNIDDDYKALFALQTTYAIIIKLIACKVITKLQFNQGIDYFSDLTNVDHLVLRDFLNHVEDGYVFSTGGIRNLLEGDFFSWYCSVDIWSQEESEIITKLIHTLESYSNSFYMHGHTTVDLFIELYMEVMPAEVRHSLGEYFTPAWLADYVVNESIACSLEKDNWKAIDPCCGSGVFVMSLIKKIIGKRDINSLSKIEKTDLLNKILSRVQGVDINPLSVLTAKVSFFLSIKPLLGNEDIEIPVYLGDSANIPIKTDIDSINCYQYTVNTTQDDITVLLPASFVENKDFLMLMSQIQAFVKSGDSKLVLNKFVNNMSSSEINPKIKGSIETLSKQLVDLHEKDWDGIWIRIVANFMLVARIKNMDIIVGNPPWVKWEFLPQAYAEKIKGLCSDRHLFSGQTYMGAISLNICALISNVTATSWLKKDGVLAFLMPQTLMTQDSYAGFRNFYTDYDKDQRMYLQKMDDWTGSGNPFIDTTEKFMTYYYQNKVNDYFENGIPIKVIKKKRGKKIIDINTKQNFADVEDSFEYSDQVAYQLDKKRTGYTTLTKKELALKPKFDLIIGDCDYKARSGVEFTPAEIYFVEPTSGDKLKDVYGFKAVTFKNSKYKAKSKLSFSLETNYVRPVIKAPTINQFGFSENKNYCIFPYNDGDTNSVPSSDLSVSSPNLLTYFLNNKEIIGKQSSRSKAIAKGNDFYSLSKVGKYTYSPHMVVFRDNTKLHAAVVKKTRSPWGDNIQPIPAKHCPYISQDKNGRDISEDESYYLCGILNAPIVKKYFKFTYSSRSFSINFNIKMPLYDEKNTNHKNIANLARKATNDGIASIQLNELDDSYIKLCKDCNDIIN